MMKSPMRLLPETLNCGLRMRRECRERFPRRRIQKKLLVSDPAMYHGMCVRQVPWCMSESLTRGGGENVPGLPGACATHNFTYLVRGSYPVSSFCRGYENRWRYNCHILLVKRTDGARKSWVNSLRPSRYKYQHWFRYWLVAWSAPSHYLNQCWNIINWTPRNKLQWNLKGNSHIFIQ